MPYIGKELYDHFFRSVDQVIDRIVAATSQDLEFELSPKEFKLHHELLYNLFLKIKEELDEQDTTGAINLDYDPADVLSEQGYDLNYIIMLLTQFRLNVVKEIEGEFQKHGVGILGDAFYFMNRMSDIFDQAIKNSTSHYNNEYQLNLQKLEKELLLLSAPVVPVKKDISVLPIVGSLNEERADHIIENVIPEVVKNNVTILIIDFSAILQFDSYVASRVLEIAKTLHLLGIHTVTTGIRPDMARAIINLESTVDDIETYRDVKEALENVELK
ncbi:STAS domain-containing protein [Alkalicoccus daliensis]|uniref:Anti-anti-sigma regulatory factor (Antagonist of anti-sigma factor) n=1 Tax=Alkalicoccus daliensis TaxID=745820 RepID=A0A1H0JVU2_9BACI|nr:STAS domain-containing protein [Alkalicoccus daliensis]SDO47679.1 Anti-anti-sigma regulatory factor (antagonist of anti-sigma factor) [Alkalicoccus daliensis]